MPRTRQRQSLLTYDQAARTAQALGITTAREYTARYREHPQLPSSPYKAYALTWRGWHDFLHTTPTPLPARSRPFTLPLDEAAVAARDAGLTTITRYRSGYRAVPGLPSNPDAFYPDWSGWPAFLGAVRQRAAPFLNLEAFTAAVRGLGVTSQRDYERRFHAFPDLPARPDRHYEDWPGWPVVLGTGRARRSARALPVPTYDEAATIARAAGWRSARQYAAGRNAHPDMPLRPDIAYRAQWRGWPVFLGTSSSAQSRRGRTFTLPFSEAVTAVAAAGITSRDEYADRHREVPGLPATPEEVYPDWPGWPLFLRRVHAARPHPLLSLPEWVAVVRAMGLATPTEYALRFRERDGLPGNPRRAYPDFPGWEAVMGRSVRPHRRAALPLAQARRVARAAGWRTAREYAVGRREYPGLPVRPAVAYGARWPGWTAFLGTG